MPTGYESHPAQRHQVQVLLRGALQVTGGGDLGQQQDLARGVTERRGGNAELAAVGGFQLTLVEFAQEGAGDDVAPGFADQRRP